MRKFIIIACLTLPIALPAKTTDPEITPQQRAEFWRANAEVLAAQMRLAQAQDRLRAAQAELQKTCGDRPLVSDPQGEPMCGPAKK